VIYKGKENMEGVESTKLLLENRTLGEMMYELHPKEKEAFYIRRNSEGKETRIRARYTLREMYVEEFERLWERQAEGLGLNLTEVTFRKRVKAKGSFEKKRNQKKWNHLVGLYGAENVRRKDDFLEILKKRPLKEYLAGEITKNEEGIRFKSNESVLFWQRPLRSQKALIGKCTFESRKFFDEGLKKWIVVGKSPAYASHPDFEMYRAYQFANNIRIGKNGQLLNDEQRVNVVKFINAKDKSFDFKQIKKVLKLAHEMFNYDDDFKVFGNKTHALIASVFANEQWEKEKEKIWHAMIFFEDSELLAAKLVRDYGIEKETADKISKIELEEGYSSVSLKAIRNILPFLKEGYRYSTAVVLGGVKNAFGERWDRFECAWKEIVKDIKTIVEDKKHKEYELIKEVKIYLTDKKNQLGFSEDDKVFGKLYHPTQDIEKKEIKNRLSEIENLRNPIVQKALFELRRLINHLIQEYEKQYGDGFRFERIQVEMGEKSRIRKRNDKR
jgi:CRISPR-associated endonuclease Csn1